MSNLVAPAVSPAALSDTTVDMPVRAKSVPSDSMLFRTKPKESLLASPTATGLKPPAHFVPAEPQTLRETHIPASLLESLLLRLLLNRANATGAEISRQLCIPASVVVEILGSLRNHKLIGYTGSSGMADFNYQLTQEGYEQAQRRSAKCTYFGAAPVAFSDYLQSIAQQSLRNDAISPESLSLALADLQLPDSLIRRLGQSLTSAKSVFLYGAPGNGKTSIAERVTAAFGKNIWIPKAISCDGEIIRLFDPLVHQEQKADAGEVPSFDRRWVRIKRPTIIVGGELTMDRLELTSNPGTGVLEAPVQLKSNCGTLVIDDFGRQRMRPDELLNRWIVPLDKRYDMLGLPNGKRIQVPFEQLLVFSTNLNPRDLADEAFLRRIPYKITVSDPTENEFRTLFGRVAAAMKIPCPPDMIDVLIDRAYRSTGRPFRYCHPRDLLQQVKDQCTYEAVPTAVTAERLETAIDNYFSIMDPTAAYQAVTTK